MSTPNLSIKNCQNSKIPLRNTSKTDTKISCSEQPHFKSSLNLTEQRKTHKNEQKKDETIKSKYTYIKITLYTYVK